MISLLEQIKLNLPKELGTEKRFFYNRADKVPTLDGIYPCAWKDIKNRRTLDELNNNDLYIGMATDGLVFLDWDKVLDDEQQFVSPDAFKLYQYLKKELGNPYAEISISTHGLHMFMKSTEVISGKLVIPFDTGQLEIYTNGQQCLLTGTKFDTGSIIPNCSKKVIDVLSSLATAPTLVGAIQTDCLKSSIAGVSTPATITFDDQAKLDILLSKLSASQLTEPEWYALVQIAYNLKYPFSKIDQWNYMQSRTCANPIQLGTAIRIAKHNGIKLNFF